MNWDLYTFSFVFSFFFFFKFWKFRLFVKNARQNEIGFTKFAFAISDFSQLSTATPIVDNGQSDIPGFFTHWNIIKKSSENKKMAHMPSSRDYLGDRNYDY